MAGVPDLWKQIGQSASVAICVFDTELRLTAFNQAHNDAFFRVNGYRTKLGDVFPDLFVPEQGRVMRALMTRALRGEAFSVVEEFGNPALGNPCWDITYGALRDETGAIVGAFHVAQDVGPRLRAEAALSATRTLEEQVAASTRELQENRACLRTIFETSFGFQSLLTKAGIVLDANATSLQAIEQPLQSVVGRPFWETPWFAETPDAVDLVRCAVAGAAGGAVVRQEMPLNLPVGGRRWFDFAMRPIRDDLGSIVALVAEAVETTERRHAEEALRQLQKMEAVGQLTGGLAHDFNNLLTSIAGSLELLQSRVAQGRLHDLDRYVDAAQGAARRAAALTQRLLAFSRRQTLDPRPTDVNRLVADMEEMIRRTLGPTIAIESVARDALWVTLVDPGQLENALLNLCINARDAMPDGGRLTIETDNARLDARAAREHDLPAGEYVCLRVGDNGVGMSAAVMAKAFDPFFTTKPIGQGTGLGLSMIYGFIRQSGGQVHIASAVAQGTSVRLYLPRHRGAAETVAAPGGAPQAPCGDRGQTVLVVDDEASIRLLVADVLEDLGFTVIEAADGAAGLRVLQSKARVDLLVTDVGLPGGMNGRQLADAARVARPQLRVLFITGYAEHAVLSRGQLDPGMHVLCKPFAMAALAGRVRGLISDACD